MRRLVSFFCLVSVLVFCIPTVRAAEVSARRALNLTLPELRFDSISLSDAIDFLTDVSGANIHVNWRALEDAGIGRDTTVNLRLRSVPLRKVLSMVLSEAGSGVLLTYEGHVKLVDFGIAKAAFQMNRTNPGIIKGKYAYMSPEQCLGHELDARSDVFNAGILLFELCTGQRLYKRDNAMEAMRAIRKGEMPAPERLRAEIDGQLSRIIRRALAADRAALWTRVTAAPFLALNEKRVATGYAPVEGGDGFG